MENIMETSMKLFFEDSPFPWWEWDRSSNLVTISPKKVEMLGYDPADYEGKGFEAYTELLHPGDYERTLDAMRDLLSGASTIYQVDYRIRAKDGSYHWYMDRGITLTYDPKGNPERIRGIVLDLGKNITDSTPREVLLQEIREAVSSTKVSSSIVAVCSNCTKIRSGEHFIEVSDEFGSFIGQLKTHTICPDCIRALYPEFADEILGFSV